MNAAITSSLAIPAPLTSSPVHTRSTTCSSSNTQAPSPTSLATPVSDASSFATSVEHVPSVTDGFEGTLRLSQMFYTSGDRSQAQRMLQQWVTPALQSTQISYKLGRQFSKMRDYDSAQKFYAAVLERFPDQEFAYVGLGDALLRQKSYKQAVSVYGRCLRIFPDCYVARASLGVALRINGAYTLSEQQFLHCLQRNPKDARLWFELGSSYYCKARYPQAVEAFSRCVLYDKQHSAALVSMAAAFDKQGMVFRARCTLEEADRRKKSVAQTQSPPPSTFYLSLSSPAGLAADAAEDAGPLPEQSDEGSAAQLLWRSFINDNPELFT